MTFFLHNSEIYGYQIDPSWMTLSPNNVITFNPTINGVQKTGDTMTGALTLPNLQSPNATTQLGVKNGPGGAFMLLMGGASKDIQPQTNIKLPGGTWGAGALVNNLGPIFQNATFTGTGAGSGAAFGAFLQQLDSGTNSGANLVCGLLQSLTLNGAGVVGPRMAGQFKLAITATGNTGRQEYVALSAQGTLSTNESGISSVFAFNPVATIDTGVTAESVIGIEVNTWVKAGAVVTDRVGVAIIDTWPDTTGGPQATRDDIGLHIGTQYVQSSATGFKTGLSFGRYGGFFPVSTNGTLIYGQDNQGTAWTVANGVDWSLGTATGNWLKFGNAFKVAGNGVVTLPAFTVATLPAAATAGAGAIAYVTDATAPTYRGALTGGGAVKTLVMSDGSAWTSH